MTDDSSCGGPAADGDRVEALAREAHEQGAAALAEQRYDDAEKVFRGLIEMAPRDALAHASLALAHLAHGAVPDAERHFRRASELDPKDVSSWLNLAKIYLGQKRTRRALRALSEVMRRAPDDAEALYLAALAHRSRGDLKAFEDHLRQALDRQSDHAAALNDLGCLLAERGQQTQEAVSLLRRASEVQPENPGIAINLGNALYLAGDLTAAHAAYSRGLTLNPDAAEAMRGLATIERRRLELDAAEAHARNYGSRIANTAMAQNLLGTVLREKAEFDAARAAFEAALAADPNFAQAATNLGMLELLLGEWPQGLARYEARWRDPTYTPRRAYGNASHWDGSAGAGRRILLFAEQGFGDSLQFARFAREVAAMEFGQVYLEAQKPLARLLATLDPAVAVVPAEGHATDVDLIAPLLSLPHLLGISGPDVIDGAAYLSVRDAAADLAEAVDQEARLRVGLNWRGNRAHMEDLKRSIPSRLLAPLGDIEGLQFFDLCLTADDAPEPAPFALTGVADQIADFADTASLMRRLDLVVTVDTATAHLAGALGVPCWLMLPRVPDWRWLLERDDCPWYASVRLFRQTAVGDWPGVIERVATALAARASS